VEGGRSLVEFLQRYAASKSIIGRRFETFGTVETRADMPAAGPVKLNVSVKPDGQLYAETGPFSRRDNVITRGPGADYSLRWSMDDDRVDLWAKCLGRREMVIRDKGDLDARLQEFATKLQIAASNVDELISEGLAARAQPPLLGYSFPVTHASWIAALLALGLSLRLAYHLPAIHAAWLDTSPPGWIVHAPVVRGRFRSPVTWLVRFVWQLFYLALVLSPLAVGCFFWSTVASNWSWIVLVLTGLTVAWNAWWLLAIYRETWKPARR
jgi:hypothetical protein